MNENLQGVLDWVNKVRADRGKPTLAELPKGIRYNGCQCVIGRALDADTTYYTAVWDDVQDSVRIPWGITVFMLDFDRGVIPELIEA